MQFETYYIYALLSILLASLGVIFYLWSYTRKLHYHILLMRKEGERYTVLKKKTINETCKSVRYQKISVPIPREFPTYVKTNHVYYFMDVVSCRPLLFARLRRLMDSHTLDIFVGENIISQIAYGLKESIWGFQIWSLVLGGILGALIGFMVGTYV